MIHHAGRKIGNGGAPVARALVLASLDAVGVARVPQLLARAGYSVSVLAPAKLAVHRSRFVDTHFYAGHSPDRVVRAAHEHLQAHSREYQWVLFGDEPSLLAAIDEPERSLRDYFPFPLDKIVALSSKSQFLLESAHLRMPLPRFEIVADNSQAMAVAERMGYPLLVKRERGMAGSGLMFAENADSLRAQLADSPLSGTAVVQEAVPGSSGSTSVLYDHGRPVCWFSYLMCQTWPTRFASACRAEIFDHPDIEILARGAGEITQFHGLAGIDWMCDQRNNRLRLLELNPRPTPAYHLDVYAGVDFASALAMMRTGGAAVQRPSTSGANIALFPQNLFRSIDLRSPAEFLESFGDAPKGDFPLICAYLRRFATHYLPASIRRSA